MSATLRLLRQRQSSALASSAGSAIRRQVCSARVISSSKSANAAALESLVTEPASLDQVAERVKTFLGLDGMDPTDNVRLAQRRQITQSEPFVRKLGQLVQWGFQQHRGLSKLGRTDAIETVFASLAPWTNMALGPIWRHFYIRQFFLSNAPLESYLQLYDLHRAALSDRKAKLGDAVALPALLIVQEYCLRGRFAEAIDAYSRLTLTAEEQQEVVDVLLRYEQYDAIVSIFHIQRQSKTAAAFDPYPLLLSLTKLNRQSQLHHEFHVLPAEIKTRADIQGLMLS